jgi:hypothetical protein
MGLPGSATGATMGKRTANGKKGSNKGEKKELFHMHII